ncbi:hypothetical protein [Aurantiacibacter luteus]|uniref:hypothetical protein n=1 Tax=Aurantiacibacter luteus TaxID=1581420 RepID=UPI000AFDE973|nr:hypothetical protein [Aurantiacibacter luteus]
MRPWRAALSRSLSRCSRSRRAGCSSSLRDEGFDEALRTSGTGSVDRIAFEAAGPEPHRRLAESTA